ncbi:MAG TPA: hypothetical protein VFY14_13590 [Streptomyces sp.]|nr:hypothetical protein [Streptomyces sp.]
MTAVLELPVTTTPTTPAPWVSYRDLTPHQRTTWHTAETKAHEAEQARSITGILTAWAIAAAALNVALSENGELVECGCDCGCDHIYDHATGAETLADVADLPTPICPACWDDHPPAA